MEIILSNLVTLSSIVDVLLGQTFRSKAESSDPKSGAKVIQIRDLSDTSITDVEHLPYANLQSDKIKIFLEYQDLLLPLRGNKHLVSFFDKKSTSLPITITNQIAALRIKSEKVNVKYLFWFFNSKAGRGKLEQISKGSTISQINRKDLENLKVPLPSLAEQKKIIEAHSLWLEQKDTLIELLDNGEKLIEKYCYSVVGGNLNEKK